MEYFIIISLPSNAFEPVKVILYSIIQATPHKVSPDYVVAQSHSLTGTCQLCKHCLVACVDCSGVRPFLDVIGAIGKFAGVAGVRRLLLYPLSD